MSRRSRTRAKHAHVAAQSSSTESRPSRFEVKAADAESNVSELEVVTHDDSRQVLQGRLDKLAQISSTVDLGLQIRSDLISSLHNSGATMTDATSVDATKVAVAASTLDQLGSLVGELQSAHSSSVKVAAALAGAVKLAQDGVIEVDDIFDVSREVLENGSVKVAALDQVFDRDVGEISHEAGDSVKRATGPAVPGFGSISGEHKGLDVFTATLRSLRK